MRSDYNHAKWTNLINDSGLKTLHALVLVFIFVALFQSEKSYIFSLKSPGTVNPSGIINGSTRPMAPAKDRGEVRL